jgi:hypothetical protein
VTTRNRLRFQAVTTIITIMSASSSRPKVNLRSTAVKRIMQEASELADPQEDDFVAAPLEVGSPADRRSACWSVGY